MKKLNKVRHIATGNPDVEVAVNNEVIWKDSFTKQLKTFNPTLYQINEFILQAKDLEYGQIEFIVKTHDYVAKIVEMKAVKPKKKTMMKSITKRVMIVPKKKEEKVEK